MASHNPSMEALIRDLHWCIAHAKTAEEKQNYRRLMWRSLNAEDTYEDLIQELKDLMIRNPAFPGDMIGWLDDDFDKDEDDEDDDSKKK